MPLPWEGGQKARRVLLRMAMVEWGQSLEGPGPGNPYFADIAMALERSQPS